MVNLDGLVKFRSARQRWALQSKVHHLTGVQRDMSAANLQYKGFKARMKRLMAQHAETLNVNEDAFALKAATCNSFLGETEEVRARGAQLRDIEFDLHQRLVDDMAQDALEEHLKVTSANKAMPQMKASSSPPLNQDQVKRESPFRAYDPVRDV